jgi:hypothetical protein
VCAVVQFGHCWVSPLHMNFCACVCVCVHACCWWLLLYAAGYFPCSERVFVSSKRRSECLKTFVRVMCVWMRNRVNQSKCGGVKKDECGEGKISGTASFRRRSGRTKDSDALDFLLLSRYFLGFRVSVSFLTRSLRVRSAAVTPFAIRGS